jgi:hypothetical protein
MSTGTGIAIAGAAASAACVAIFAPPAVAQMIFAILVFGFVWWVVFS